MPRASNPERDSMAAFHRRRVLRRDGWGPALEVVDADNARATWSVLGAAPFSIAPFSVSWCSMRGEVGRGELRGDRLLWRIIHITVIYRRSFPALPTRREELLGGYQIVPLSCHVHSCVFLPPPFDDFLNRLTYPAGVVIDHRSHQTRSSKYFELGITLWIACGKISWPNWNEKREDRDTYRELFLGPRL
jgi:hypothetical protein